MMQKTELTLRSEGEQIAQKMRSLLPGFTITPHPKTKMEWEIRNQGGVYCGGFAFYRGVWMRLEMSTPIPNVPLPVKYPVRQLIRNAWKTARQQKPGLEVLQGGRYAS